MTDNKGTEKSKTTREKAFVKRSTDLALIPLQNFTAIEINFYYSLLYFCQNKKVNRVKISFEEFRKMSGYTRRGDKELLEKLRAMSMKFSHIGPLVENKKNGGFKIVIPFIDFEADPDEKSFTVGIHSDFMAYINELDGSVGKRYALADVRSIVNVKSTYSKQCLGYLSLYRKRGYWETSIDELKYYLDIPAKYRTSDINKQVLSVVTKELEGEKIFDYFDVTPRVEEDRKKSTGRKKTLGYIFTFKYVDDYFDRRGEKKEKQKDTIDCPICGKKLIKKARKDGTGYFYGHKDGWDISAPCRFTISAEKVEKGQISNKSDDEQQDGVVVTAGELNNYYRHIREKGVIALAQRKDVIRDREPGIWDLFMAREKMRVESMKKMTTFAFTEEGRSQKQEIRDEVERSGMKLKMALKDKGYDMNYLEMQYMCPICKDTGQQDNGLFCSCRATRVEEAAAWIQNKESQGI